MNKEFALEPGGPKRLKITYNGKLTNAEVLLDGQQIMAFSSKPDFLRGTTCKLPDGSALTVRYGPVEGLPVLKGVHVIRNGAPLPGSAADPVPRWAWVFIIACALIPVVTLGGGIPALIGFAGVGGALSVSRLDRWSVAMRTGVCALITVACWGALGLLMTVVVGVQAVSQPKQSASSVAPSTAAEDKLIHQIGVTYYQHGYRQSAIEKIKDNLYDECDRMQPAQCQSYLGHALAEAQNSPNLP